MEFPDDLKYTREHEWIKMNGKFAAVGVTDYAQDQLGDIVYVEFPDEGEVVSKGDAFVVLESTKAVSDVYAPISGKVVEINDPLKDNPETVNEDCYGEGWLIKLEIKDPSELDDLMGSVEYKAYVMEEKG